MDADYREIGMGIIDATKGKDVGPILVSQEFGNRFSFELAQSSFDEYGSQFHGMLPFGGLRRTAHPNAPWRAAGPPT